MVGTIKRTPPTLDIASIDGHHHPTTPTIFSGHSGYCNAKSKFYLLPIETQS